MRRRSAGSRQACGATMRTREASGRRLGCTHWVFLSKIVPGTDLCASRSDLDRASCAHTSYPSWPHVMGARSAPAWLPPTPTSVPHSYPGMEYLIFQYTVLPYNYNYFNLIYNVHVLVCASSQYIYVPVYAEYGWLAAPARLTILYKYAGINDLIGIILIIICWIAVPAGA